MGFRRRRQPQQEEGEENDQPLPIIPRVEKLIQDHAYHPRLAAFYSQLLSNCHSMQERHRQADRRMLDDDDEF